MLTFPNILKCVNGTFRFLLVGVGEECVLLQVGVATVPAIAKWCRGGGMNICWELTIIVAELKAEPAS